MWDWTGPLLLLAEGEKQAPSPFASMLPLMLILIALFYFVMWRPQRREQQRRKALLTGMKKNDRVVTIGGIIGTIANISADNREVTLKIDENVRMKVLRTAIQGPLNEEEAAANANAAAAEPPSADTES